MEYTGLIVVARKRKYILAPKVDGTVIGSLGRQLKLKSTARP
jgi:hypothetical protein